MTTGKRKVLYDGNLSCYEESEAIKAFESGNIVQLMRDKTKEGEDSQKKKFIKERAVYICAIIVLIVHNCFLYLSKTWEW